jgi:Ca-activated chloride channel family protein
VFGIAGGLGAVAAEILSEPIYLLSPSSFMGVILFTASWSGLISLGVSMGLLIAHNIYLKRRFFSKSLVKTAILGIVSGALAGALAQVLFTFTYQISTVAEIVSRIICWGIMASGVGLGVSLFVPNYPRKRAMLAGLLGGTIGGVIFRATFGLLPDTAGRIFGTCILGVFIGITISVVEEILREAWITIDWGKNETTNVCLGTTAVVMGSSPEADIYLPRNKYPPVTAIIKIENSKVIVDNKLDNQCTTMADNGELAIGALRIIIHTKKEQRSRSAT